MKYIFKPWALLLLAVVGILTMLYAVPYLFNMDEYKKDIVAKVSAITGRNVEISGGMQLMTFPLPHIEVTGISINNNDGGVSAKFMEVQKLDVRLSPIALLMAQAKVSAILLDGLNVNLENFDGVGANWNFGGASGDNSNGLSKIYKYMGTDTISVTNAKISIKTGSIDNPAERSINLFASDIKMESLLGPYDISGKVDPGEVRLPIDFNLQMDELSGGESDLEMTINAGLSKVMLNGKASLEGSMFVANAKFEANIDVSLKAALEDTEIYNSRFSRILFNTFSKDDTSIKGDFYINKENVGIKDIIFSSEKGGGKGAVAYARNGEQNLEVGLEFTSLDIDKIVQSEIAHSTKEKVRLLRRGKNGGEEVADVSDEENKDEMNASFLLNVAADEVVYNGKVFKNVLLKTGLLEGNTIIRAFEAHDLPGNFDITWLEKENTDKGNGQKKDRDFAGKISAGGDDVGKFFKWINPAIKIPDNVDRFSINADVVSASSNIKFPVIRLEMAGMEALGQAVVNRNDGIVINSAFKIPAINIDDFMVNNKNDSAKKRAMPKKLNFNFVYYFDMFFDRLNLSLASDNVTFNGDDYKSFSSIMRASQNRLVFDKVSFLSDDFGHAKGVVKVDIKNLKPIFDIDFKIDKIDVNNFISDDSDEGAAGGVTSWSKDAFDFSFIKAFNKGKAHLFVENFVYKKIRLSDVDANMSLDENNLAVSRIDAVFDTSKISFNDGILSLSERPALRFGFDITNIDLKKMLVITVGYKSISGVGSISGSVAMSGFSPYEWVSSLEGSSRLFGRQIAVKGIDFTLLSKKLSSLSEIKGIRYWAHRALTTGKSRVDFFTASASINYGEILFQNIGMTNSWFKIDRISAKFNLPKWLLDIKSSFSVRSSKAREPWIPLKVSVSGAPENPYILWDPKTIDRYWESKYFTTR